MLYHSLGYTTFSWGAHKLMGDNLKLVCAEFSTISYAVLMMCMCLSMLMYAHIYN